MRRLLAIAGAVLVLAVASDVPAEPAVRLLGQGTFRATDGRSVEGAYGLQLTRDGRPMFHARSTALVALADGQERILMQTGDALPAPLSGTFSLFGPLDCTDDGATVFTAAAGTERALFLHAANATSLLVRSIEAVKEIVANRRLDVVMASSRRIDVRQAGATTATHVAADGDPAPGGGELSSLGNPPALDEDGAITFVARVDTADGRRAALFRWSGATGLELRLVLTTSSDLIGTVARSPVAVNRSGTIAFLGAVDSRLAVLVWPVGSTTPTPAAIVDTPYGATTLTDISHRYLAIDDAGLVTFAAATGDEVVQFFEAAGGAIHPIGPMTDDFTDAVRHRDANGALIVNRAGALVQIGASPRPAAVVGGSLIAEGTVLGRPAGSASGQLVVRVAREGLYAVDRRKLVALSAAAAFDEELRGASIVSAQTMSRDTIAVAAYTRTKDWVVGRLERKRSDVLLRGSDLDDPSIRGPLGGIGSIDAVSGRIVMLYAGLSEQPSEGVLEISPDGPPRIIGRSDQVLTSDPLTTRFEAVVAVPDGAVVRATSDTGSASLVFFGRDGTQRTFPLLPGERLLPGASLLRASGRRVSFVVEGSASQLFLLSWSPDRNHPARVVRNVLPVPGYFFGTYATNGHDVIALDGGPLSDGERPGTLFALDFGPPRTMLQEGLAWQGITVERIAEFAPTDRGTIVLADVGFGGGTQPALLRVRDR